MWERHHTNNADLLGSDLVTPHKETPSLMQRGVGIDIGNFYLHLFFHSLGATISENLTVEPQMWVGSDVRQKTTTTQQGTVGEVCLWLV